MRHRYAQQTKAALKGSGASSTTGSYGPLPKEVDEGEANLISSRVEGGDGGVHEPVLDVDLPCELWESKTPGHFHLVIHQPMRWETYVQLLHALAAAGIIQRGFLEASLERHATYVRVPVTTTGDTGLEEPF